MNDFTVIAMQPLDIAGTHYEPGETLTANCHELAQHLIFGRVRMSNASAPAPPRRPRGRPRKTDSTAPSYKRRDLQAEE